MGAVGREKVARAWERRVSGGARTAGNHARASLPASVRANARHGEGGRRESHRDGGGERGEEMLDGWRRGVRDDVHF